MSADVISQIEDGSIALREFARVLKPGGILVLNVAAYQWMWSYHDDLVESRHRFRRGELVELLIKAGFKVSLSSYANTLIFPLIIAQRKIFIPANPTSDVKPFHPLLDSFCGSMASLEYAALRKRIPLPVGNSVFIVARRLGWDGLGLGIAHGVCRTPPFRGGGGFRVAGLDGHPRPVGAAPGRQGDQAAFAREPGPQNGTSSSLGSPPPKFPPPA